LIFGVVIAIAGLGMPATETNTVTSCVEDHRGIPNDNICTGYQSSSTVEVENTSRGPTILGGVLIGITGGVIAATGTEGETSNRKDLE
jgi:hypothetical protein